MIIQVKFNENNQSFKAAFGEAYGTPDDNYKAGYDLGYGAGYDIGEAEGYKDGYKEGEATGFNEGYEDGYTEGFDTGLDNGKQSEYDAFWDAFQDNGKRSNYSGSFGAMWTAETLKPKYDMKLTTAIYMFAFNEMAVDLVEYFESLGKKMDFSQCRNMNGVFQGTKFTRLGDLTANCPNNWYNTFAGCSNLVTIDRWGAYNDNEAFTGGLSNCFQSCPALENITVNGIIGWNINFQWSTKLTRASIESIINHLSNTSKGTTLTLSKTAADNAFPCWMDGVNYGAGGNGEWLALVETKPNWTINLV